MSKEQKSNEKEARGDPTLRAAIARAVSRANKSTEKEATRDDPTREAREALRAAIQQADAVRADLAAAELAVQKAKTARYLAEDRLEALREREKTEGDRDLGAVFMNALAAGETLTLNALAGEDRAEIAGAFAREIAVWISTQKSCARVLAETKTILGGAETRVERRADDVLRTAAAAAIPAAIERVESLQCELIEERLFLRFVERHNVCADDDTRHRVRLCLTVCDLPMAYGAIELQPFHDHSGYVRWTAAREALLRDADAPLPTR